MKEQTKQQLGAWYEHYSSIFDNTDKLSQQLAQEYSKYTVFPEPNKIFKAFELCKLDSNFKVVILGQDPYPGTLKYNGKEIPFAQGYAFGNPPEANTISPSLQQIKDAVIESGHLFLDQTLENWQSQGVLLLNTTLTVRKNSINSHKELWSDFTQNLIASIGKIPGITWVFWGNDAKYYKKLIYTNHTYIVECEHPQAANYQNRKWKYEDCFNRINQYISKEFGETQQIKW